MKPNKFDKKSLFLSGLALLIGGMTAHGARVPISNFSSDLTISRAEFENAQRAAGNGGTITFAASTYNIPTTLVFIRRDVSLIGAGAGRTILDQNPGRRSNAMFQTDRTGTTIRNMTLQGRRFPTFNISLDISEGQRVATGVESGIRINGGAQNIRMTGCVVRRISLALDYESGQLPNGLRIRNSRFVTGRGIVNCRDGSSTPVDTSLIRRMVIDNADFTYRPGQGGRGITMDYGNNVGGRGIVNMRGSEIINCTFDTISHFSIDINRVSNITIRNNVLNGGGAGNQDGFVQCVHMEDFTSCNIINNVLFQRRRNDRGDVLTLRVHVQGTGRNVTVADNAIRGSVNSVMAGTLQNWTVRNNTITLSNSPNIIINGFRSPSSINLRGTNTVNGSNLRASQINLRP